MKYNVVSVLKVDEGQVINSASFDEIEECKEWSELQLEIKDLNFNIFDGERQIIKGIASGTGIITWIEGRPEVVEATIDDLINS